MTNPKIEKVEAAITKTKASIAEYSKRLRDLERQKTELENLEIIALFRREKFSEDEFKAFLDSHHRNESRPVLAQENEEEQVNEHNKK